MTRRQHRSRSMLWSQQLRLTKAHGYQSYQRWLLLVWQIKLFGVIPFGVLTSFISTKGSFTTFSWRSIVSLSQIHATNPVMVILDHAPAGNGSYGVYVDKVVLSASSPNPSGSTELSTASLTATSTHLISGTFMSLVLG